MGQAHLRDNLGEDSRQRIKSKCKGSNTKAQWVCESESKRVWLENHELRLQGQASRGRSGGSYRTR